MWYFCEHEAFYLGLLCLPFHSIFVFCFIILFVVTHIKRVYNIIIILLLLLLPFSFVWKKAAASKWQNQWPRPRSWSQQQQLRWGYNTNIRRCGDLFQRRAAAAAAKNNKPWLLYWLCNLAMGPFSVYLLGFSIPIFVAFKASMRPYGKQGGITTNQIATFATKTTKN